MRDDLREAYSAVYWAIAHIPVLQERLISWQRSGPYKPVMQADPNDPEWELLTVEQVKSLDPLISGDIGAIINSIRTALDILMYAVLARYTPKPKDKTHFPICATVTQFLDIVTMMETKKRIGPMEAAAIKDTRAYRGGDPLLYVLHQLDILRKHERLLVIEPAMNVAHVTVLDSHLYAHRMTINDKPVFYRFPAKRFRPAKSNTHISAEIFFNEPTLWITKQPTVAILRHFARRVSELIVDFP